MGRTERQSTASEKLSTHQTAWNWAQLDLPEASEDKGVTLTAARLSDGNS